MKYRGREIRYFFYSQAFVDGFRATIAILLPALVGLYWKSFETGLLVSLGAMSVSLTDAPGPVVHRRNGMVVSSFLAFLIAAVTGFAQVNLYALGAEVVGAAFFFSMLNAYGARATSVGNSAMLMMILTMDVPLAPTEVLGHASLIFAGGMFYALLSLGLHALRPYRVAQRVLGDCLNEIATYLSIKADFYDPHTDIDANYQKLIAQQVVVNEKQESVREILFKSRQIVEESTAEGRRLIFAFVEAVDLFEEITATSFDYASIRQKFGSTHALQSIHDTLEATADELKAIGFAIQSNTSFNPSFNAAGKFDGLKNEIDRTAPNDEAANLVLRRLLVNIRQLFTGLHNLGAYFQQDIKLRRPRLDASRFVSRQPLDPRIFWNNLSPQSFAFRHALRVCIACAAGFVVAKSIAYGHHSYWILLTIAFILKPAYSLTKQRNIQRFTGTLAGGAIGILVLVLTADKTIHFIFLVLFMIATYSFMRIQYLVMVICMTPYILILFSFLGAQFEILAGERLLDTAIGCAIAFSASYFLFPTWEADQLKKNMLAVVRSNTIYLRRIMDVVVGQRVSMLDYKLARKDVYVNSANLAATFQRVLSEPKSKQQGPQEIHQFVVLNHILFSAIANLSGIIFSKEVQSYPTDIIILGRKALTKLQECTKKLGGEIPSVRIETGGRETTKHPINREDVLLAEQMNFIYSVASDLDKLTAKIND